MDMFGLLTLIFIFTIIVLFFVTEYYKKKKEKEFKEKKEAEAKEERINEFNNFIAKIKKKYEQKKCEITADNIKPKDSILSLNKNESVYLESTNLLAIAYKKEEREQPNLFISLLVLTNQRLILIHKDTCEAFKIEDIKHIDTELFGITVHLTNKFEYILFELLLEEIVRFERTAEKLGIPIKRCIDTIDDSKSIALISEKNIFIPYLINMSRNPWWQLDN